MSDFVAPGAETAPETGIANNGFFPDIDPALFRLATRQDKTVTAERLAEALTAAMASVNRELAPWQVDREAEGYGALAGVDPAPLGGLPVKVRHYLRAVYSLAKAELAERYRDFDATNSGRAKADEMDGAGDAYRRDARWALADLQGRPRTAVELI